MTEVVDGVDEDEANEADEEEGEEMREEGMEVNMGENLSAKGLLGVFMACGRLMMMHCEGLGEN